MGLRGQEQSSEALPLKEMQTAYRYASPEVVPKKPYSLPLDIWSTGVIVWEMLQDDARKPAVSWHSHNRVSQLGEALLVSATMCQSNATA
jgi:serine/threonine protein kinase